MSKVKEYIKSIGGLTISIKKQREEDKLVYFTAKISRGFLNQTMEFGLGGDLSDLKNNFETVALQQVVSYITDALDDIEEHPNFHRYLDSNLSFLDGFDEEYEATLEDKIEAIRSMYDELKRRVDSFHLIVPKKWNHNNEVRQIVENNQFI